MAVIAAFRDPLSTVACAEGTLECGDSAPPSSLGPIRRRGPNEDGVRPHTRRGWAQASRRRPRLDVRCEYELPQKGGVKPPHSKALRAQEEAPRSGLRSIPRRMTSQNLRYHVARSQRRGVSNVETPGADRRRTWVRSRAWSCSARSARGTRLAR